MDSKELQHEIGKAEAYYGMGEYKSARDIYEGLRVHGNDNPKIFMRLGDISKKDDDTFAAIKDYKRAAGVYAGNGATIKAMAVCKTILGLTNSRTSVEEILSSLSIQLRSEKKKLAPKKSPTPKSKSKSKVKTKKSAEVKEVKEDAPLIFELVSDEPSVDKKSSVSDEEIEDYIEIIEFIEPESDLPYDDGLEEAGLKDTPLFSDMSTEELMRVIKRLKSCYFSMGEYVFRKEDDANSIFVIVSGAAEEIGYTKYDEEVKCVDLVEGDFFGVREYFSGLKRMSEVRALTDLELLEIKRNEMGALTAEFPYMSKVLFDFYKERILNKSLALSKVFRHLTSPDRKQLLERVRVESVPEGEKIIKRGEQGDCMFIILSGSVEVWKEGTDGKKRSLVELQENDYFGEVALLLNRARTASVTAITGVDLMIIEKKDLDVVLKKYPIIRKVLQSVANRHVGG